MLPFVEMVPSMLPMIGPAGPVPSCFPLTLQSASTVALHEPLPVPE
jgi:hypothetical protein